ncbi:phage tail domain-containing protein [Sporosarcina sp. FSL K6-2383]|uniref:phage tail domain-containing protein n=1 Tax=Sporosarcina sp. FSL K6-2383 TaxID=2921556 RepID=UPI00315AFB67
MLFKLQFENSRGQKIELYDRPFRLSTVEGLGDVGADIQMQKAPYQDGSTLIDTTLESRQMTIELKIHGKDAADTESKRRLFASIFNPKLGIGTLKYIRDNEVKIINAVAESVPFFPDGQTNRKDTFQKALLYLICPSPHWRSPSITEEPAFEPRFRFPTRGPFIMGIQRDRRVIINDGDAPAPVQVEFFGPALNPKIINQTTGEYIKINQELLEDERMIIDTTDSTVYFIDPAGTKRNVFPWIDLSSTFFYLQIGENDIEYTADSDIQGTIVNISYSKLYTAI